MQANLKIGLAAVAAMGVSLAAPGAAWAEGAAAGAGVQAEIQTQSPSAPFAEAQLEAFAAASAEIEPINAAGAASPEARAQANIQIGAVLQRHNLDAATYNAIVDAMRADENEEGAG